MTFQPIHALHGFLIVLLTITGFNAPSSSAAGLLTPVGHKYTALELSRHEVEVTIQDGFSVTTVDQTFTNPHSNDLDALYTFPVPDGAAVSEFTVWIDDLPVTGEVFAKAKAREIYQQEKAAGRETGLAEQNGYQRFEISVSPVRAGQKTRIRMQYLQVSDLQTGIGRYVYPLESGGVDEGLMNFWTAKDKVTEQFRFRLNLRSAYPIEALRAPNIADAVVTQSAEGEWTLEIDRRPSPLQTKQQSNLQDESVTEVTPIKSSDAVLRDNDAEQALMLHKRYTESSNIGSVRNEVARLDEDIVMYWRMAKNLPGTLEMIAHREPGESQGSFMLVMTPGNDLKVIEKGRDWVFVLDISGSMQGKYSTLAEGVRRAFKRMQGGDRFRIVLFNNNTNELTNGWTEVSPATIAEYSHRVSQVNPGGGTDLFGGIYAGLKGIDPQRTTGMVLVTDGVANVGETQKRAFLELLAQHDIRLFSFIMGNEANRPLLKSIAKASNGFALNVSNSDDIVGKIMQATQAISHEAMHDVELKLNGARITDLTPEYIGSVYRGEQIVVFGHYWEPTLVDVSLSSKISGQEKTYRSQFELPHTATSHPEIERLWAYAKINALKDKADIQDDANDTEQAMTDIAIKHGLVTPYTSMVVMRESSFQARGIERKNQNRVQKERNAQQQRVQQAVTTTRVDNSVQGQQPMFTNSRATHSGSGSTNLFWLLLLLPLVIAAQRQKRSA